MRFGEAALENQGIEFDKSMRFMRSRPVRFVNFLEKKEHGEISARNGLFIEKSPFSSTVRRATSKAGGTFFPAVALARAGAAIPAIGPKRSAHRFLAIAAQVLGTIMAFNSISIRYPAKFQWGLGRIFSSRRAAHRRRH
jgi:hypothetical protein